jgi:soluble lytic murein transglycosylase-like protein
MTDVSKEYLAILESELQESMLKKLAIGAALAGSAMLAHHTIDSNNVNKEVVQAKPAVTAPQKVEKKEPTRDDMIQHITSNYKVNRDKASEIVDTAIRHANPVYPKAHDIVAVMGVESEYKPEAKSKLKRDPAIGLMQVRPGVNGINPNEFKTIDGQVKHGASILSQYYKRLGNPDAALHAYNVGIGNHIRGIGSNPRYVDKVKAELSKFSS